MICLKILVFPCHNFEFSPTVSTVGVFNLKINLRRNTKRITFVTTKTINMSCFPCYAAVIFSTPAAYHSVNIDKQMNGLYLVPMRRITL